MKAIMLVLMTLITPIPLFSQKAHGFKEAHHHHFWRSKQFWETTALVAAAGAVTAIAAQPPSCDLVHGGGVFGKVNPNGRCIQPIPLQPSK